MLMDGSTKYRPSGLRILSKAYKLQRVKRNCEVT